MNPPAGVRSGVMIDLIKPAGPKIDHIEVNIGRPDEGCIEGSGLPQRLAGGGVMRSQRGMLAPIKFTQGEIHPL
jgi:hypothetical protein